MSEQKGRKKSSDDARLTPEQEPEADLAQLVQDHRSQKIMGALLLFLSFFILVAILSHTLYWQKDQDVVRQWGMRILLPNQLEIGNVLGTFGAFVSHFLVYESFGIASVLFAAWFGSIGANLLLGRTLFPVRKILLQTSLSILWISIVLSILMPGTGFHWGGELGEAMASWLTGILGLLGTGMFLLLIGLSVVIWHFDPEFARLNFWQRSPKLSSDGSDDATLVVVEEAAAQPAIPATDSGNSLRSIPLSPLVRTVDSEAIEEDGMSLVEISEQAVPPAEPLSPPPAPPVKVSPPQPAKSPAAATIPDELTLRINNQPSAEPAPTPATETDKLPLYDPILDLRNYKYPTLDLLEQYSGEQITMDAAELNANKEQIEKTLENYSISIKDISATVGPTVTLYEVIPADGVRIARIRNLEDDIALSLSALGIRIIAPIPGKGAIGIEVPNVRKSIVGLRSLLASDKFKNSRHALPVALGKKIDNQLFIVDLATMPHLLMAGATGQGKSVGINAVLASLLYKKHPSQLKFVLVDPKKVELSLYTTIEKHFLAKLPGEEDAIITDTRKVVNTLNALCIEMDTRYDLLKEAACRNIREYNEKFVHRKLSPQKGHQFLPFIVLVIDEFADLIMTAGKEIEMPIARLAQLARAVGIHLVIATQRPSVNIITGTIKANFPARIAFKVSSRVDSRTILDTGGAEQLIGRGDMLVSLNGEVTRVQCVFVDTPEVERIVEHIGAQQGYPQAFQLPEYLDEKDLDAREVDLGDRDTYFEEAARLIVQNNMGSTSLLQRRLKLGYNRAGRLMDQLEAAGIVGPNLGSKAREVLFRSEAELDAYLQTLR
ncbi:MAG: DNA translocase FtsK [Bacteroidetes bacterium]|nr:DNA translocase FtsK [Bacteroidota bacterium]